MENLFQNKAMTEQELIASIKISVKVDCFKCSGRGFSIPHFWQKKYIADIERIKEIGTPWTDEEYIEKEKAAAFSFEVANKTIECEKCKGAGHLTDEITIEQLFQYHQKYAKNDNK